LETQITQISATLVRHWIIDLKSLEQNAFIQHDGQMMQPGIESVLSYLLMLLLFPRVF